MWLPDSIRRWASAAWRKANVAWMIGRILPASTSGQTVRSTARAIAPFSSTVRARSTEPVIVRRWRSSRTRLISAFSAVHDGNLKQPALDGKQIQVAGEVGRADHVEDHVDAATARQRQRGRHEILFLVVDRTLGAQPLARIALLVGACRREHARAKRARHLNRRGPDSAGASVHEERFAVAKVAPVENVHPDREKGLGHAAGGHDVEPLRNRQALNVGRHAGTRHSRRPRPARRLHRLRASARRTGHRSRSCPTLRAREYRSRRAVADTSPPAASGRADSRRRQPRGSTPRAVPGPASASRWAAALPVPPAWQW